MRQFGLLLLLTVYHEEKRRVEYCAFRGVLDGLLLLLLYEFVSIEEVASTISLESSTRNRTR
jgi:hypothetical protein